MPKRPFITIDQALKRRYDCFVIGSGPAGTAVAQSLARCGRCVMVIESGGLKPSSEIQEQSRATVIGQQHADPRLAVCRAIGGTSRWWGGRCVALDPIDFEARPGLAETGWPIGPNEITPWYDEAYRLLGCDLPAAFADVPGTNQNASNTTALKTDNLEIWCNDPHVGCRFLAAATASDRIDVLTEATVSDLAVSPETGRVTGLTIIQRTRTYEVDVPGHVVLACSGLETTRLLLTLQVRMPLFAGGAGRTLGRYYQGHVSGVIAELILARPSLQTRFTYRRGRTSFARSRLRLSDAHAREKGLPNVAFWPDNPRMANASHGNGTLSSLYLLLASPIGSRLIAEAIRAAQTHDACRTSTHIANVLRDLPRTLMGGIDLASQWFVLGRRHPLMFMCSREGRFPLHFHAEQFASACNRLTLEPERDATGLRRLRIDYSVSNDDVMGCIRAHKALDAALRTSGYGSLAFPGDPSTLADRLTSGSLDGFHQIGTTRMGNNARTSVVDTDATVHGTPNLHVASSSVFPTSGQANPTLAIVALALRLANHLNGLLRSGLTTRVATDAVAS